MSMPITTSNSSIFELKQISHYYKNAKSASKQENVLEVDELTIPKGSITGLMGPNGSGKSTLLKLLAFAFKPTSGTILFNGRAEHPFSKNVRFNITLLTQEPYLLKRSVYDNIYYGLKIRKIHGYTHKRAGKKKIRNAMAHVGLEFHQFAHRKWNELSGGEAQRVAMAARLVLKPQVLLLDEPTASVDVESAALIRDAAKKARLEWGTTVLVASHDRNWLGGVCDSDIYLRQGRIGTKEIV